MRLAPSEIAHFHRPNLLLANYVKSRPTCRVGGLPNEHISDIPSISAV